MFNIGGGELLLILLVALIVLGPDKLPDAARQVGQVMREFRRISNGFQKEMREAMKDPVTAATQDRKLQNRVSFSPPPPFSSQEADPETPEPETAEPDVTEPDSTEPTDADTPEPETAEPEAPDEPTEADAEDADGASADAADEPEEPDGPDGPEVAIPSDR